MRLQILAVGRLKSGPERELVARYGGRIEALSRTGGMTFSGIVEMPEGRDRSAAERQGEEAAALLARVGGAKLVAFDERGADRSSQDLAAQIGAWRDGGADLACAIGGPDGFRPDVRERADLVLAFGRMTLPHQFVRVLVAEQIYRCLTILSGHPYHRGGGE